MPSRGSDPSVPYDKYPIMRLALHQMRTHYPSRSGRDRLAIFNKLFHAQLLEAGFKNGKLESHDTLDSQYRESRKAQNQSKWAGIVKDQDELNNEEFLAYQTLICTIKQIGKGLGLEMKSVGNHSDDDDDGGDDEDEDNQAEERDTKIKPATYVKEGTAHESRYVEIPEVYGGRSGGRLVLYDVNGKKDQSGGSV